VNKVLFVILFFCVFLEARENPFFPLKGEMDMPYTSNKDNDLPPLKRVAVSLPSQARIIKKITVEYKTFDGSIEKKSIQLENSIDWHLPLFVSQNYIQDSSKKTEISKQPKFQKLAGFKYGSFFASKNTLKIISTDKVIRDFLLIEPYRIVLDFKRDTTLKSFVKNNKNSVFKKIRIGNHNGYYRVVIELDGKYKYKKEKISNGYMLVLK